MSEKPKADDHCEQKIQSFRKVQTHSNALHRITKHLQTASVAIALFSMASRTATKALRSSAVKQLTTSNAQRRTFVSALNAARTASVTSTKSAFVAPSTQQKRGLKTIDFAGTKETVFGACDTVSALLTVVS